jgi:L-rhamnose mutarotase
LCPGVGGNRLHSTAWWKRPAQYYGKPPGQATGGAEAGHKERQSVAAEGEIRLSLGRRRPRSRKGAKMLGRVLEMLWFVLPVLIGIAIGWLARDWGLLPSAYADETNRGGRRLRVGAVIGLKPELREKYQDLHAHIWHSVVERLMAANFRNYSIYLARLDDGRLYLFSYFEYTGHHFDRDAQALAADPDIERWWAETDPCLVPQQERAPGEHWMTMTEVYHHE